MNAYELNGHILLTRQSIADAGEAIPLSEALAGDGPLLRIFDAPPLRAPSAFPVTHEALFSRPEPGLWQLSQVALDDGVDKPVDAAIVDAIAAGRVTAVNRRYPDWRERLASPGVSLPRPARVQLVALGDVGGVCLLSMALLSQGDIADIGVYDLDNTQAARWTAEINQCAWAFQDRIIPPVRPLEEDDLFQDCDVFVFAASAGVPSPGREMLGDVRQVQYEKNSRIVAEYARKARTTGFKGLFVVLSDPVERLCQAALRAGTSGAAIPAPNDLRPEQITGFGLGVMHGRAIAAASLVEGCESYAKNGRAYGRHGDGLVLANDPVNYNDVASQALTEKVAAMNLDVRALGYKPYIAPAVSSGAMTLLATLRGDWAYSATYMDGCYFGAANRWQNGLPQIETTTMDDALYVRLHTSIRELQEVVAADAERDEA